MTDFPTDMPAPVPNIDDAPFWAAAAQRRLVLQRCRSCGTHRHPPSPMCPTCQATGSDWSDVPARGELFSYTVTHVAPLPALHAHTPYVVALVRFPGFNDVRLVTNIVGSSPEQLQIGADVELVWELLGTEAYVPRFRIVMGEPTG